MSRMPRVCLTLVVSLCVLIAASDSRGADLADTSPAAHPNGGPGTAAAKSRVDEFDSRGIDLQSWLPVTQLDSASTSASDCWGYTSPSGREYAIIGVSRGTVFVEITDPAAPQVLPIIVGPNSVWRDMKVYDRHAYAVSEGGGGVQVIDLTSIDEGIISWLRNVANDGTTTTTHNVAVDEVSGFLYRCGGGGNGLRIYDLSDPATPSFVASWNKRYVHDAQVVTYVDGPFAGKQVAFCNSNDTSGGGNPGLDILDVTDKSNIVTLGSINLSAPPIFSHRAVYSHQGWLSPDRRYFYSGDEADEFVGAGSPPTTTRVIDVSDLSNPVQVAVFTNNNTSVDHNLYTRDEFIFEANYTSGLRVFDATDPIAPVEIAYFDTYPPNDAAIYRALWSVYPFFPSGTIIGSDFDRGLFVWRYRECRLLDETVPDCNGNGSSDECDIIDRVSDDCNGNGVPDECDTDRTFSATSPRLGPLHFGSPRTFSIGSPPEAGSDVVLSFTAFADLGSSTERVTVTLNGVEIAGGPGSLFVSGAGDCSDPPDVDEVILAAETFNALVNGGPAVVEMIPWSAVSTGTCAAPSYIIASIEYQTTGSAFDCNANLVPDACDAAGDFDGDGLLGIADFADSRACFTGPCGTPPCDPPLYADPCCALADRDGDGDFDLEDFQATQLETTNP